GGAADPGAAERGDLHDAECLEATERFADRRLARPELAGDLRLDDPGVGRVPTAHDPLEEALADLVCEDAPGEGGLGGDRGAQDPIPMIAGAATFEPAAFSSTSTVPVDPFTRIRSPVRIRFVATEVPTTAGIPNSRDNTAGCDVVPPVSVTSPAIFVKRTTQAG